MGLTLKVTCSVAVIMLLHFVFTIQLRSRQGSRLHQMKERSRWVHQTLQGPKPGTHLSTPESSSMIITSENAKISLCTQVGKWNSNSVAEPDWCGYFKKLRISQNVLCNQKGLSYLFVPDAGGDALSLSILSAETLEQQVLRPRLWATNKPKNYFSDVRCYKCDSSGGSELPRPGRTAGWGQCRPWWHWSSRGQVERRSHTSWGESWSAGSAPTSLASPGHIETHMLWKRDQSHHQQRTPTFCRTLLLL